MSTLHSTHGYLLLLVHLHLHPRYINSEQGHAIEAACQKQKAKTLPLPLQTLDGERYLIHNWFGSGSEDVRAVAASQYPALGPPGDVQEPGDASLPSCCCGWWTTGRQVATLPWRVISPGSATPMRSYQADDVLMVFVERMAAGEAADMPWAVVWEAAETPNEANGGQVRPKCQVSIV
jgi:hypothetical protein